MKEKIEFFYRVSKEAEREKMKDGALKYAARSLNINTSLLTIVTEEEYQQETEEY